MFEVPLSILILADTLYFHNDTLPLEDIVPSTPKAVVEAILTTY
jgi:hypothetical protein